MGKKKKQEKEKKQREKQQKEKQQKEKQKNSGKDGQKTAGDKKDKAKKKDRIAEKAAEFSRKEAERAKPSRKAAERAGAGRNEMRGMAERFRALGDENRLRILMLIGDGELCAADILKSMSIVQSTLSHHMKILTEAGVVKCRRQGKWSYYSVDSEVWKMLGRDG